MQLKHSRRRVGRIGAAIAAFLAVLPAASAAGFSNSYCGVLLNQGSWCGDGSNHSYNFNQAEYRGSGSVWVCERLLIADTSTQRSAPTCAYNYAARSYSAYAWLTEAEATHLNSTGARHTIYGYATA